MVEMYKTFEKITLDDIKKFEAENNVKLTELYTKFLLENNGGYPKGAHFVIPDGQGEDSVNVFFGIGDIYENLGEYMYILDGRLPEDFIPIGSDPAGNAICLGIKGEHYEQIYFWDHEQEADEPDMSNMYYLAPDIFQFVDGFYESE